MARLKSYLVEFLRWKFSPFILHSIVVVVVIVFMLAIRHQRFALEDRRMTVILQDGSTTLTKFLPLQSDITTLISLLASLTRVAGAAWASHIEWRCAFLFMARGGISLRGVDRMFNKFPPFPGLRDFLGRQKSNLCIFFVILVATSLMDYFSSVLTGSVTWRSSYIHVPSTQPFSGITRAAFNDSLAQYKLYLETYTADLSSSALAVAAVIWGGGAGETVSGPKSMHRVLPHNEVLTVDSVVHNVTLPFFAVDSFEWIKDYETQLTAGELGVNLYDNLGPFKYHVNQSVQLGLLPQGGWGANKSMTSLPAPLLISETRTLIMRPPSTYCDMLPEGKRCKDDDTIPANVKRRYETVGRWCDCFVYARVTYRAGVAQCLECRVATPYVVQSDSHRELQPSPDALTREALDVVPYFITVLLRRGQEWVSLVPNRSTYEAESVELLSRAYQVVWHAYTQEFGTQKEETKVKMAVKVSQADVSCWRVLFWGTLHLIILVLGCSFVYLQRHSNLNHPWMKNPALAGLLLDTSALTQGWMDAEEDPWEGERFYIDETLVEENEEIIGQPRRIRFLTLKSGMQVEVS